MERSECHSLHSESISSEVYVETVTHISADITEVSVLQSQWVMSSLFLQKVRKVHKRSKTPKEESGRYVQTNLKNVF